MHKFLRIIFSIVSFSACTAYADCCEWKKLKLDNDFVARDSAGSAYFDGNIVLIGGWKNSGELNLRSIVLIDELGKVKKSVAPDMDNADLPVSIVFKDKVYVISGWVDGRLNTAGASSSVHSSGDALSYRYLGEANFPARVGAAGTVFKGKLYIIGGTKEYHDGDYSSYLNDVWASEDGLHYELVQKNAAFPPRAFHQAFVFNDMLCIAGGGGYKPTTFTLNDIWCSEDGKEFEMITSNAAWEPRIWFGLFVYDNKVYVLGGDNLSQKNEVNVNKLLNDVWVSDNLSEWRVVKFKKIWSPRHAFSTILAENQKKVYVVAGHAMPLTNDVWYWDLPDQGFE